MSVVAGSKAEGSSGSNFGNFFVGASNDVDEQATLLRGWNQSYAQMSAGKFYGTVKEVQLRDSRLFTEFTGQTLLQYGVLPPELIAIGLPLKMAGPACFCGMPDEPGALHVFSGGDGFEFYSPREMTMAGLVIPRAVLEDMLFDGARDGVWAQFDSAHLARVDPAASAMIKDFIAGVLQIAEASPNLLLNGPIMNTLHNGLVSNVAALVESRADLAPDAAALARRWAVVARARETIHNRPDEPISIAELCRVVGVSRRTLQYCFQDVLNVSPASFLRAVRLNGVRRTLRTATSVTEAAAYWGFWHFGHFSRDYTAMFGELPSQTHRRFNPRRKDG